MNMTSQVICIGSVQGEGRAPKCGFSHWIYCAGSVSFLSESEYLSNTQTRACKRGMTSFSSQKFRRSQILLRGLGWGNGIMCGQ